MRPRSIRSFLLALTLSGVALPAAAVEEECKPIDVKKSRDFDAARSVDHGITALGIRRTVCFGTVEYEGRAHAEPQGKRTGKIDPYRFHNIARLIDEVGFMCFADSYTAPVTDNPTVYVTVTKNGRTRTVSNYANAAPQVLWAIEQLIDDLKRDTKWDGPAVSPAAPRLPSPKAPATWSPAPVTAPVTK
jgi:hypothetical protein